MKKIIGIAILCCISQVCFAGDMPEIHGFIEGVASVRVSDNKGLAKHARFVAAEQRVQLKTRYAFRNGMLAQWRTTAMLKGDLTIDEYFGGKTSGELREAVVNISPLDVCDVKIGRQVLTWGTGDLLFINDIFPKDYVSFYSGRDDEYLKKPSDALRISLYPSYANIDIVYMPVFTPTTIPEGDRLSFFDSFQGGIAGRASDRDVVSPSRQLSHAAYALRVYRYFGSLEGAVYISRGYDTMPRSYYNQALRKIFYQRQDVYGVSFRGPALGGISSIEAGYVYSAQDTRGDNRLIENSSVKAMAGYEKDWGNDFKTGFQYYYEQKLAYQRYLHALVPGDYYWGRARDVVTVRLTKLFFHQTMMAGGFVFYSPADRDAYIRAQIRYDITDRWKVFCGANIPMGEDVITDFGQMRKNKNVYMRLRRSF